MKKNIFSEILMSAFPFLKTNVAAQGDGLIATRSMPEIIADTKITSPLVSEMIQSVASQVKAGQTTLEINNLLASSLSEKSLYPTMLNFRGFPAVSAISVSPEILHAPPSQKVIKNGDLVTIQLSGSSSYSHASQGWTIPVGDISQEKQELLYACRESLENAIEVVQAGITTHDISMAIQSTIDKYKFSPIMDFCGYAMGRERIEQPNILGYASGTGSGSKLKKEMILNIHVLLTTGRGGVKINKDNWTAYLGDDECSAIATAMVLVEQNNGLLLNRMIENHS